MPTRKYFTKAVAPPPRPAPRPRLQYKGRVVIAKTEIGPRSMGAEEAARQMARSKGGLAKAAVSRAGQFTTETARKAVQKLWAGRWRVHGRRGLRIGRPLKVRPYVARAPIRAALALEPSQGLSYDPATNVWVLALEGQPTREVSEVTALRRLGYIPTQRKNLVPTEFRILRRKGTVVNVDNVDTPEE